MNKILLVAPMPLKFELTQDKSFLQLPLIKAKSFTVPLHIATVAALTPDEFDVQLWDESVHGPIEQCEELASYDLVGITGYTAHLPRACEIAERAREHGILTAIGGPGISTNVQRFRDNFDVIFVGEAEQTWPRFLADWKSGSHEILYRQISSLDLADSPLPRWDSIAENMMDYHIGGVQTSRGCPFDCEFCDVSHLFGRGTRYKSIDNILEEVAALQKLGMRRVIFCDDNFIGNRRIAKDLLRRLIELNATFDRPMAFATELTIDVAKDDDLLELLADANFAEIFIGIESPNKASLKETNKLQNVHSDLLHDIKKVQSYGMSLRASFIVGFDSDTKDIFDQLVDFVNEGHICVPSIRVLMAPPATKLWQRMYKDGRLLMTDQQGRYFGNPGTTNIIPKNMTRTELHSGYLDVIERIYDWESFSKRFKAYVSGVKRRPNVPNRHQQWARLMQLAFFLVKSADARTRRIVFGLLFHTLWHAPFLIPRMVAIILRQYGYATRPELRDSIRRQIELEETGAFELVVEPYNPLVPDSFRKLYADAFSEVYERVAKTARDARQAEETMTEIFGDYLLRGAVDSESEAEQKRYLLGLADQIISVKDGNGAADSGADREGAELTRRELVQLETAVIKAVEQDLLINSAKTAPA